VLLSLLIGAASAFNAADANLLIEPDGEARRLSNRISRNCADACRALRR